jgi:phospholipase/carboxylesterase
MTTNLFFKHLPAREERTEQSPILIMLHGRGSDEMDLFGLAHDLDPRLEVFSIRAPHRFPWGGFTWFELRDDNSVDEGSFRSSLDEIKKFIEQFSPRKIYLFGFSMGTIVSYALALRHPELISGVMAFSGFAPKELMNDYKLQQLQNTPIFIAHGTRDMVITIDRAHKTKELLSASNASVSYHEYDMAHEISHDSLIDASKWLIDQLS